MCISYLYREYIHVYIIKFTFVIAINMSSELSCRGAKMSLSLLSIYCTNILITFVILIMIYFIAAFTFVISYTIVCQKNSLL